MYTGLETNARPLARGELNSVRASGSSDLTSPVGEWIFYEDLSTIMIASIALGKKSERQRFSVTSNESDGPTPHLTKLRVIKSFLRLIIIRSSKLGLGMR